jgi:hypothetical protein
VLRSRRRSILCVISIGSEPSFPLEETSGLGAIVVVGCSGETLMVAFSAAVQWYAMCMKICFLSVSFIVDDMRSPTHFPLYSI